MNAITLKLRFIVFFSLLSIATYAQCSGCNLTITVPNSTTYNLTAGQTICIVGSGNFTGRLDNFNGNTLCIGTGVNYNPSTAPNYNGNWTIINNGTFTNTSNLNFNSGTSFTNAATGSITLSGTVNINAGTTFNNYGTMNLSGLTINGGGSVQLGGRTVLTGTLSNNGNLSIQGSISAASIVNNSGATIRGGSSSACNYLTTSGSFTNNGSIGGSGNSLILGVVPSGSGSISAPATTSTISTPSSQPSSLNLSFDNTNINGSFTQASSSVGGYIILRASNTSSSAPASTNPSNYATLSVGQTLGAWTVIAFNNGRGNTTFSDDVSDFCNFIHYRILSYNISGNCRVYRTSSALTGSLNIQPNITGSTPATRCGNGTVTLSATVNYGTVNWYSASSGGTLLGTGTTFTTPSISATTNYFAEAVNNSCTSTSRTTVTATVNAIPTITGSTSASRCGQGTVNLSASASLGTINWYTTASGGTSIATGTSFTTPSLTSTTLYYVEATHNGCTTPTRTSITATINNPTITATSPGSTIGPGSVTLGAIANYGTINWYANATGGSILGSGTSYTTPYLTNTTTYYVEVVNGSCTSSPRTAIIASVEYPEIDVRGNNTAISDGSATASASNFTLLGSVDVAVGSITRTYQLRNLSSTAPLNLGTITITGTNASDFSVGTAPATTIAPNGSTTFTLVFNPSALGTRSATLSIANNDPNENPFDFIIQGLGITDIDGDGIEVSLDTDDDNDGIIDISECRTCTTDPFQNGSFETPVIPLGTMAFRPTTDVIGWQTSAENVIEIWSSGFNGVNAAAGNQFAELNANVPGVLYQTFCLNGAGGTINYSLRHRGRLGTDTAYMKIGNTLANALASTPVQTLIDGNSAWGLYSGVYTIPAGMRQVVITFQAGPTATGDQSIGNFIDDIQVTINQSCVDTDNDGIADINDLDSDNDGVPDIEEAGFAAYSNQTSTMDKSNPALWVDANGNGLNDYLESILAAPSYRVLDSDGDNIPNYIDLDSDNDSYFDVDEAGLLNGDGDINGDGRGDYADADGDGIMNIHDNITGYGTSGRAYAQDTDADGVADFLDLDSNNDGTFDITTGLFANLDGDNNGRIDGTMDTDGDGLLNSFDTDWTIAGSPRDINNKLYLNFDGRNDYAQDSQILSGMSNLTMMAWIDLAASYSGTSVIMGQTNCQLRISGGRVFQAVINGTTYNYTNVASLNTRRWYHVAMTLGSGQLTLYVNGDPQTFSLSGSINTDTSNFTLGKNPTASNLYFNGKIDEVRIFNVALSDIRLQRMINQEIQSNGAQVRGTFVPRDIESTPYANLIRYYRMDTYKDDIIDNLVTITVDTGTGLKMYNHKVIATQEAPMPYVTVRPGDFATAITDTTKDIDGSDVANFDWNIIDVRHNITETSNATDLAMVINSGIRVTMNNDTKLQNAWYLKLDGVLDLQGRSQLIQTNASELDVTSAGSIERDQQGTKNIYNYNYWSSPVSTISTTTNNSGFTVAGVVKDGTTATPQNITWTSGLDGAPTSPITLSSYWIFKFQNLTNTYANWQSVGQNGTLLPAQGFTLKGSGATGSNQNLTFVGKPNNGTITTTVAASNLNLTGNPYPSAIDANLFINANTASITGSLYFWEHAGSNNSHNLSAYQGGYSVRNLVGGVGPSSPAGINGVGNSSRVPQRYIPVGQGFFVVGNNTGGTITFTNSQRTFIKETNASSNSLFRLNNTTTSSVIGNNQEDPITSDQFTRLRLGMTSKDNYHRNILLGFMENLATPGLDYGYDAESIESQPNDVYFLTAGTRLTIQGDDYFNVNKMYPIGVKAYVTGEIQFMIDEVENLPSTQRYYILDNVDGVFHDITNNPYTVEVPQGNTDNRFVLAFKDTSALNNTDFTNSNSIQLIYTSTNDVLIIKNNVADATIHKVILYNMLGQEVMTFKVNGQDQSHIEIPVNGISSGTYITKVVSDKGTTSKKIVFN